MESYSKNIGLATYLPREVTISGTNLKLNEEIKALLDEEYAMTKKLLTENKDKLDRVVKALIQNESLTEEEFKKLVTK